MANKDDKFIDYIDTRGRAVSIRRGDIRSITQSNREGVGAVIVLRTGERLLSRTFMTVLQGRMEAD